MTATQDKKQIKAMIQPISDYVVGRLCAGVSPSNILAELEGECELERKHIISLIKGCRESLINNFAELGITLDHPKVKEMAIAKGFRHFLAQKQSVKSNNVALPKALWNEANGLRVECNYVQGQVCGLNRYSKTHVSGHGNNQNWQINSETYTVNEFFVRDEDGMEHPYTHYYDNVRVNNGHQVTNIHLSTGSKSSTWAMMINHTTGESWYLQSGNNIMYGMGAFIRVRWWWMLITFLPFLLVGVNVKGNGAAEGIISMGLFLSLTLFVIGKVIQGTRAHLAWRKLKPELDELSDALKQ